MDTAKEFVAIIEKVFDDFLAEYQFLKCQSRTTNYGFSVTYRNNERYVRFGGTLHPHDYPYYYYLSFGEGSDEFPESDWNSVALWRLIQDLSPEDYNKHRNLYEIPPGITKEQIEQKIETNRELSEVYGTTFLNNDLDHFRHVRSSQNTSRESYKIYSPNDKGKYTVSDDEQSSNLKKKYSQE